MAEANGLAELKKLIASPDQPEMGPGPRANVQPLAELSRRLDELFQRDSLPPARPDLIRATVLLWHDHLDAAHTLAQSIENADGSYVHGLMHRREPDYGNARYWFRRVGQHPCFAELAAQASALLRAKSESVLEAKLVPRGQWDPFAFIDACEKVAGRPPSDTQVQLLRAIQAAEFEIFLRHLCGEK